MGDRAAKRTNKMLDKFSGMYVGKNFGYSGRGGQYADAYERAFGGKGKHEGAGEADAAKDDELKDVLFGAGPLGMEIVWSAPPVVSAVVGGGTAERAKVKVGSTILEINGSEISAIPEFELDHLMQQRPLRLLLAPESSPRSRPSSNDPATVVKRQGVLVVPGVLRQETCGALAAFALDERARCAARTAADPAAAADVFSRVQVPRARPGAPETRWDLRLPLEPVVREALQEALWEGDGHLGPVYAALAGGPRAELWELGVVASEPGAAPQPVHFDAPERGLYTAFVALQDVAQEMGPTIFLPGTNTQVAHHRFEADPATFLSEAPRSTALLGAGDAAVYDSRVLHCGTANRSDKTRVLMYITFRDPAVDVKRMGIDQHSIRSDLAGRFRLGDFRES